MTGMEIYALTDPRDGATRYIGKAKDAKKRLRTHMYDAPRRNTPVYRWIRELGALGLRPTMTVLVTCSDAGWQQIEREQIARERSYNPLLLNVAIGGNQPLCPSHISAANGRINSRARVSTPLKARLWKLKRAVGEAIYRGYATEGLKEAMRYGARKRPDLFGEWAGI